MNVFEDLRLELYQNSHDQGIGFDTSTTGMPSMPILSEETNTKDETPCIGVSKAGKEIYKPSRIPSPNFRRKISVTKPKLKGNDILMVVITVFNNLTRISLDHLINISIFNYLFNRLPQETNAHRN